MDIAITTERADEKGWIAFAPEVRATAQGSTEQEAKENLRALLTRYPDLLEEPRQASDRRVELIRIQRELSQLPSLPELKYRELINLLKFFATDLQGEGSPQLKVTNRSGKSVAVHCHPSQSFWPQALSRLIRDLEITRDEFWEWSQSGRKAR